MSSSENVFTTHSSSYSQQNGDILSSTTNSRPSRATMESIKSVHENPFYKNFGIRHIVPSHPRPVSRSLALEQSKQLNSNGRSSSFENNDIGEYRPGSGYVHKLLDKFSSLTAREEQVVTISHLKRSSSLDELPIEKEIAADKPISPRATGIGYEKPSYLSVAKLSHRARSIESLNNSHHKPHHSHAVSLRHVETKWGKDKLSGTLKSQRDFHNTAPDLDLARDDIIIVENTISFPLESESDDGALKVVGNHELMILNELPKPNTVFTVRSIFESASSGSGLYTRRQKSDSPMSPSSQSVKLAFSPQQTQLSSVNSPDGLSNQVSSHSPSPVTSPRLISSDSYTKPILVPSSSTLSKADNLRYTSDSILHSRPEVVRPSSPIVSNSSSILISSQQADNSDVDSPISPPVPTTDGQFYHFKRESSLEDAGSSGSPLLPTSLRSTTSGKLILTGKPAAPLSPSATSSYHRSPPANSSASLKNIMEDSKKDELPVMIFNKSNLSPRKGKSQRTKDYTLLNNGSKEIKNEEINHETKEAMKKFIADDTNKSAHEARSTILSQRNFFDSNAKTADKSSSDQSKIIYTKHHTTIELNSSPKSAVGRGHKSLEENSKQARNEADVKLTKPVAVRRTNVSKSRSASQSPTHEPLSVPLIADNLERVEKQVTPSLTLGDQSVQGELIKAPDSITTSEVPEINKEKSTTSKRSHSNDSPALNEQPLSKVSKDKPDSKKEPVKGIPSIIAERLKKQNYDPSQVAENVLSSPDATNFSEVLIDDDTNDGNIFSLRHLSPSAKSSSVHNNDKDSLSSEIENEIAAVRKKMEGSRSKSAGPAPIFDSSQLSKKRREKKKQQSSASQERVPSLDLSGITDHLIMEYHPQPKSIAPCNIIFIGENAKTSRSLLVKQRKIKISIHFNDAKTETFEYPNEEIALEQYLLDHPHEKEEILVLEDFSGRGDESSDDVEIDVFETPVTPRGNTDDDLLKANTALAHTGSLQSYRGRYQQDYQLGTITLEQPNKLLEPEPTVDPEKLMLRPAEEDDTNTWSTSSSSDILF